MFNKFDKAKSLLKKVFPLQRDQSLSKKFCQTRDWQSKTKNLLKLHKLTTKRKKTSTFSSTPRMWSKQWRRKKIIKKLKKRLNSIIHSTHQINWDSQNSLRLSKTWEITRANKKTTIKKWTSRLRLISITWWWTLKCKDLRKWMKRPPVPFKNSLMSFKIKVLIIKIKFNKSKRCQEETSLMLLTCRHQSPTKKLVVPIQTCKMTTLSSLLWLRMKLRKKTLLKRFWCVYKKLIWSLATIKVSRKLWWGLDITKILNMKKLLLKIKSKGA